MFSQCLIAGFGLQEKSLTRTGFLNASIIPNHSQNIHLDSGIITIQGAYFVELLPGDSGGPLLCYKEGNWFDLGTASAHSWEYESIYSANSNLDFSASTFMLNKKNTSKPVIKESREVSIQPAFLAPYSIVETLDGEVYYSGDLDFITLSNVVSINLNQVKATINVKSASMNFLCLDSFLCYRDIKEVIINKHDILDNRYTFPPLYNPFQ